MKRKIYMLVLLLLLIMPYSILAKEKVPIYFFRGEGCPHCADAEDFFDTMEDKYKNMFTIKDYEVWYDADNAELMKEVAKIRGEEERAIGVPYIIIGDKSWIGYSSIYDSEIKAQIETVYEQSKRYDVMDLYKEGTEPKKETKEDEFEEKIEKEEEKFDETMDEFEEEMDEYGEQVEKTVEKATKMILPVIIGAMILGVLFIAGIIILVIVLLNKDKKKRNESR